MGPHIFDVVRFLFGEIDEIQTIPVSSYQDIPVDDTALSLLRMQEGFPVLCTLAHKFHYKAFIQFENGTITLNAENNIEVENGQNIAFYPFEEPTRLSYIPDDDWAIHGSHVFAAIPTCLQALRYAFVNQQEAETSGKDNLKTMQAVFAAIRSVNLRSRKPAERIESMRIGISSWSYPYTIGNKAYDLPAHPMGLLELANKAVMHGAEVLQVADNLPLHNISHEELLQLRSYRKTQS